MAVENTVSEKAAKKIIKYMDAEDKNVRALIVYSDGEKYYLDVAKTVEAPYSNVELFMKNALLQDGTYLKRAIGITMDSELAENSPIVWADLSNDSKGGQG